MKKKKITLDCEREDS